MSHKHESILHIVFHDPLSGNIHWREVESLLHHLGAQIEPSHGARFQVTLNDVQGFLHHPHHGGTLNREDIKHLREFLTQAGVSASQPGG